MDSRSNPVHGQGASELDDCFSYWPNLGQGSLKLADFTGEQELSVLLACTTALQGTSPELDYSFPRSESLASSYDDIGIIVEPVDASEPQTDAIAATPSTSTSINSFPADNLPNAGQPHTFGQDFSYPSDLTDSASASTPGTSLSKEPFISSRLAKRSMSFTRSSGQRGRLPFRRDSRPPDIDPQSRSPRRELSPLDILPRQPSTGPHTEPNETSFDWSESHNPAFLSPPSSSTLETRRKRSASFRSNRAASVSGQPGSAFLNVPGHSSKSGPTRRRSTSVPSEPSSNFCPINLSAVTRSRAYSSSQSRSPAASLTTSPSGSSFEDPQDSNGSGRLPPFQLPPAHAIYNPYDISASYQPSPDFPLIELDSLNIYTHRNSSNSSIASQHSVNSQASLSPQLHPTETASFLQTTGPTGFDINVDYLASMPPLNDLADDLYHDNSGGGPSISVTNTDDGSVHPDNIFIQASDADLHFFMPDFLDSLHPSILDYSNDLSLSGGQSTRFTDPFSSIESVATSPAETLPYPAASPGNSEQSFNHFDSPSPATPEYGNATMPSSSFPVHTFSEGQDNNKARSFAGSQGETRTVNYTVSGEQHVSGTHPRTSATAMHEMHGNLNNGSTISKPLKQGVRPRTVVGTSSFHVPVAATGTYPHCDRDTSAAEGSGRLSSHSSHHLGGMAHHGNGVGVGTTAASGHIGIGPLHENQLYPYFNNGFSDPTAPSPSYDSAASAEASSSSSMRRSSKASDNNNLDPQFEAKKWVYKILTESTSKDKAFEKVMERVHRMKSNLIRSVFDDASQRKVKSTPAGQQRAQDRRSRPPTFFCILCQNQFTTNNNLQNHYRSHLKMDQYRCPRCGDYFRTEGIRKRHTESAQKCCRLDGP